MLEAMTHFNLDAFTHLFSEGEVMGPFSRPSVSQSYVLRCADGKWIALHMSSPPKFWQGLAKAIEQPDLFDDPRFATREARIEHQGDADRRVGRLLRSARSRRMVPPPRGAGRAARADVRHRRGAARCAGQAPAAVRRRAASGRARQALDHRALAGSASTASVRCRCVRHRCSAITTKHCVPASRRGPHADHSTARRQPAPRRMEPAHRRRVGRAGATVAAIAAGADR